MQQSLIQEWRGMAKPQRMSVWAAYLGWTLDAFDFTVFLLIMAPIAAEFGVPIIAVTAVFSVTLIMRLLGATASGWMADRMGRRAPLMISILWYSVCNFAAGFSPTFTFLFVTRALLGIGMGAEWPAGAALAMESWPARSRGLMSGVLQGSWGLGFALSALAYGFLYGPLEAWHKGYGWRGMLILGVLPALACVWIRIYVKEPEVWVENKRLQAESQQQFTMPLFAIFKGKYLYNTLTGCLWMAMNFCVYYAVWAMLGTYLTKELGWTPAQVAVPVFWGNIITFLACSFWGAMSERVGRRYALMIPMAIAVFLIPLYITQTDHTLFLVYFLLFIAFFSGKDSLNPAWLSERFPTEVRATASGFVYHQGAVWGAAVAPILTYLAVDQGMGYVKPMMYSSIGFTIIYLIAVYLGPETKGTVMTAEIGVLKAAGGDD